MTDEQFQDIRDAQERQDREIALMHTVLARIEGALLRTLRDDIKVDESVRSVLDRQIGDFIQSPRQTGASRVAPIGSHAHTVVGTARTAEERRVRQQIWGDAQRTAGLNHDDLRIYASGDDFLDARPASTRMIAPEVARMEFHNYPDGSTALREFTANGEMLREQTMTAAEQREVELRDAQDRETVNHVGYGSVEARGATLDAGYETAAAVVAARAFRPDYIVADDPAQQPVADAVHGVEVTER